MTDAEIGTGRKLPGMLVVRGGWMTYYAGSQPGDEQPVGGGSYNEADIGYEVFNFLDLDGQLRGYANSPSPDGTLNLERIDPNASGKSLKNVLVAIAARNPKGGQVVVGWYRKATVYRFCQEEKDKRRSIGGVHFGYHFETSTAEAVLLPLDARHLSVPHGTGGMVRANIFYLYDESGQQRNLRWLEEVVDLVERYDSENLLQTVKFGPDVAAVTAAELHEISEKGQGYLRSAAFRKAIEERAMTVVNKHFHQKGWQMKDHSASHPYDFLGVGGGQKYFIEVKGTQNEGGQIFLTPNEVEWARKHYPHTVLAIVTGIEISEQQGVIKATKGTLHLIKPWRPDDTALVPLVYRFDTGLTYDS